LSQGHLQEEKLRKQHISISDSAFKKESFND
jgi:hypothetical protein